MRTGRTRPVQTQKSSLLNIDFPRLRNALGDVDTDFISGKSVRRLSRLGDHMAMSQLFICIDNEADIVWFIDVFLIPKDLPNNVVGIGEGVTLTVEDRFEIKA
ncbi:MAG: hypothetical protein HQ564_03875, partial [Candidatus Saganbacteria bacterium]|nr:hypothetical protein [Candidatus Saganbacteria bacterium]